MEIEPVPGEWYQNVETHQIFRVIDVSETESLIEIQHVDGDLGELDMAVWEDLDLEWIEPPENWTAPYDDVEEDDLGYTDAGISEDELGSTRQNKDEDE